MNHDDAKFILNACRPGGRDAEDRACAEALSLARTDEALSRWWQRSQSFDAQLAARLAEIAPPAGLRETLLTGGRLSSPPSAGAAATRKRMGTMRSTDAGARRRRWIYGCLAAAAVLIFVSSLLVPLAPPADSRTAAAKLAELALSDLGAPGHIGDPDAPSRTALAAISAPLTRGVPVDFERMAQDGCRSLSFGRAKVLEVCFRNGGVQYHLYVLRRSDANGASFEGRDLTQAEGRSGAAAAWSSAQYVFALAAGSSADLRRLLP